MDALTTTDADAITLSGLSYFCAAAARRDRAQWLSTSGSAGFVSEYPVQVVYVRFRVHS